MQLQGAVQYSILFVVSYYKILFLYASFYIFQPFVF